MGFGILFIGYFLILNIAQPAYSDLIAGLVMFMAFYKLQPVNKYFTLALIPTALFSAIGAFELIGLLLKLFGIRLTAIGSYISTPRLLLIAFISILMLTGIEQIAKELDVEKTKGHVRLAMPLSYIVFALYAIFDFPNLAAVILPLALGIIYVVLIFAFFITAIINLVTVYSAYMRICMPEDVDNVAPEKPSRFGFVNKFREHEKKKSKEYAEYKLGKTNKKALKKKRK